MADQTLENKLSLVCGHLAYSLGYSISHPCLSLQKRCQVNVFAKNYHLSPVSFLSELFHIKGRKLFHVWKGNSNYLIYITAYSLSFELIDDSFPTNLENDQVSTLSILCPFYVTYLLDSIESNLTSEGIDLKNYVKLSISRLAYLTSNCFSQLGMLTIVPTFVVYNTMHITITSLLNSLIQKNTNQKKSKLFHEIVKNTAITCLSSLFADFLLYPIETIMHRLMIQGTRCIIDNTENSVPYLIPIVSKYTGFLDCYNNILANEGIAGFYRGLGGVFSRSIFLFFIARIAINLALNVDFDNIGECNFDNFLKKFDLK
ncbi:Solute carrier family 25 member 46 [Intoshia linei]|uniref:Solute carrier family 25 member 46 n=1 Tax=Intoshia linei TaxID=1819745 RepID=A0A177B1M3_9BILA|nr:Solute carrier family 25 member 46 [Intoshia linei]